METKQTAVDWLKNTLEFFGNKNELVISWDTFDEIFERAKQMEKKQMIDFAMQLHKIDMSKTGTDILINEAEQLYKNLYGK